MTALDAVEGSSILGSSLCEMETDVKSLDLLSYGQRHTFVDGRF